MSHSSLLPEVKRGGDSSASLAWRLAVAQPEKLEQGRALLESEAERARELQQRLGLTGEQIKLEEEMKRRLRGLGYVR